MSVAINDVRVNETPNKWWQSPGKTKLASVLKIRRYFIIIFDAFGPKIN